jgi:hypothetical protein
MVLRGDLPILAMPGDTAPYPRCLFGAGDSAGCCSSRVEAGQNMDEERLKRIAA